MAAATRGLRLLGTRFVLVMRDYVIYLDDSGTDPAQRIVVVAGYISTAREWKKFTKAWLAALARYGLPYFHMSEFMTTRGTKLFPKADWPDERKDRLITELVAIIGRHAMVQLGVGIPKHEWDAAVSPAITKHLGPPFAVCLHQSLRIALRWLPRDLGSGEQVGTVFDQGSAAAQRDLLRAYTQQRQINEILRRDYRLGPLQFEDKRRCPPLQAADVPALLHYQALRDRDEERGRVRDVYLTLHRRLGHRNAIMTYMTESGVRRALADGLEAMRAVASASDAPASLFPPSGRR